MVSYGHPFGSPFFATDAFAGLRHVAIQKQPGLFLAQNRTSSYIVDSTTTDGQWFRCASLLSICVHGIGSVAWRPGCGNEQDTFWTQKSHFRVDTKRWQCHVRNVFCFCWALLGDCFESSMIVELLSPTCKTFTFYDCMHSFLLSFLSVEAD